MVRDAPGPGFCLNLAVDKLLVRDNAKSAIRSRNLQILRDKRAPKCFGKPDGPDPSAKITERARATARGCLAVAEALAVAGKLFREAQLPASKLRERARATRPLQGCRRSFGRRPENSLENPTGPTPASQRREQAFGQTSKNGATWPLITCLCGAI